ncbi:MAG: RHS repeat-associated core domain-containing protein, partial [Bacteroidota bacterium]
DRTLGNNQEYCNSCGDSQSDLMTTFGSRFYELTNHLGNVTTVFGEDLATYDILYDVTGNTYQAPSIRSYKEYTPFGLNIELTPNNPYSGLGTYRYGFNGKENDEDGEFGNATHYDYGFRIYNPMIARFLSVDPLADHPNQVDKSPYQYAWNNPVSLNDPDGRCPFCPFLPFIIEGLVGGGVDYGFQVAGNVAGGDDLGTALTNDINGSSILISTTSGVLTAGGSTSSTVAKSGGLVLAKRFGLETSVDVGESVAKQALDGDVTLEQTVSDVLMTKLGGAATSNFEGPELVRNISFLRRRADRARRIANGDPASSGRAATAAQTRAALNRGQASNLITRNASEDIVGETAENTFQEVSNYLRQGVQPTNVGGMPAFTSPIDNTRVVVPLLSIDPTPTETIQQQNLLYKLRLLRIQILQYKMLS